MGKKKKVSADHVRHKRKETNKKVNPFEVKVNRQKHNVLGRKISKQDKGMPGLSRSKATKRVNLLYFKRFGLDRVYSRTSMARTLMARLPLLFRTRS